MFEIERGVPVPTSGRYSKYPFAGMQVGDSFFVPEGTSKKMSSIHSLCNQYGKKHGGVYKARRVDGGMRVWRVE